ncbi:hypothetical protein DER46DRAFT_611945 [Fusarium sp. MPI-SDFR-AT-0072]|nr:hypothetical protein DER46DRAFT_611945 [Fusarium sp. MPI-SDFR-AT-0072]
MPQPTRPKTSLRKPRSHAKNGPAFVFVDIPGGPLTGPEKNNTKTIVRRQAARSAHTRHQDDWAKRADVTSPSDLQDPISETNSTEDIFRHVSTPESIPLSLPSGYETFRSRYNFDITDLTSFIDVDLATNAYRLLQDESNSLVSLLQKQHSSFLAYLPSRYGSSTCLDDAMRCVAARAGQMLGFPIQSSMPLILYGKALKSLQHAISDAEDCALSDIYCATRLLVLYELIGPPDTTRLAYHHRGGIRLLKLREPGSYTSEFDWMLLKSQGPSIIIGEMYRNESSMFEAQEWQNAFQSASDLQLDADCRLWWKFFGITGFLPGILKDLRSLLEYAPNSSDYSARSLPIRERAQRMHKRLHDEHVIYQHTPPHPPSLFTLPIATESPDRIRLRCFFLYTIMYISRVIATVCPSEIERATSEVEAQTFASQAILIDEVAIKLDPAMSWHLQQRNELARSIIEGREEWLSLNEHGMSRDALQICLKQRWIKWEESWRALVLAKELKENRLRF